MKESSEKRRWGKKVALPDSHMPDIRNIDIEPSNEFDKDTKSPALGDGSNPPQPGPRDD